MLSRMNTALATLKPGTIFGVYSALSQDMVLLLCSGASDIKVYAVSAGALAGRRADLAYVKDTVRFGSDRFCFWVPKLRGCHQDSVRPNTTAL